MQKKTCPLCTGKKRLVGLGMIMKDCPKCDGVGTVMVEKRPKKEDNSNLKSQDQNFSS